MGRGSIFRSLGFLKKKALVVWLRVTESSFFWPSDKWLVRWTKALGSKTLHSVLWKQKRQSVGGTLRASTCTHGLVLSGLRRPSHQEALVSSTGCHVVLVGFYPVFPSSPFWFCHICPPVAFHGGLGVASLVGLGLFAHPSSGFVCLYCSSLGPFCLSSSSPACGPGFLD